MPFERSITVRVISVRVSLYIGIVIAVFVSIPDLVYGQVADSVSLDVFERGPVTVRTGAQRQVDLVDHDGFHIFDAQFRNSCNAKRNTACKCVCTEAFLGFFIGGRGYEALTLPLLYKNNIILHFFN